MINLWRRWILGWKKPDSKIKAAMVTPLIVMRDGGKVKSQAKQIAKSGNYNCVATLIDLQPGRTYIEHGRTTDKLTRIGKRNLESILGEGLPILLIFRNDWAQRTKKWIPSFNGVASAEQFYGGLQLQRDKLFLQSIKTYWPYIHIQISLEPDSPLSAGYAVQVAEYLRKAGFKGRLICNPIGNAVKAYERVRGDLDRLKVTWARSDHDSSYGDSIANTDGNTKINAGNAKEWLAKLKAHAHGEYILWSKELANSENSIQKEYL
jgi:hypothetical protein